MSEVNRSKRFSPELHRAFPSLYSISFFCGENSGESYIYIDINNLKKKNADQTKSVACKDVSLNFQIGLRSENNNNNRTVYGH